MNMNSQVCIQCHNKKPINLTDNRLVTESCGHVKCMDCLLNEKSGCLACKEITLSVYESYDNGSEAELIVFPEVEKKDSAPVVVERPVSYDPPEPDKIKKPETSHIQVENDAKGRCYLCTLCKKRFYARSHIAYHAYCNGQKKPYQCSECNKSFASQSHFKYHMRVHRNEKTYSCEICQDSFFQKSKLQRHMLKHTQEKKYICTECSKAFNDLSALRKHSLTHNEERPFACDVCGLCFKDPSNYRRHVAKHDVRGGTGRVQSARRRHQCPRCPQAFYSGKDMRRHAAVHTDSKPFRCKVCNRRFRRKDNLERHIRNTHPDCAPAAAVDCDETELMQINTRCEQTDEKTKLEILNPLPPLPQEVIQRHMQTEPCEREPPNKEKSYILEANHARESVIFGPVKRGAEEKKSENEYVHKIRKAHSMVSQKGMPLPPIDEKKIIELEKKTNLNHLDLGAPPKNMEPYKRILSERLEKDGSGNDEEAVKVQNNNPEMHWKRKMKLDINW